MGWLFNNKRQTENEHTQEALDERGQIEIVAHKQATKEEIDRVKEANAVLKRTFAENGFHIKIYLAAGGSHAPHQPK